MDCCSSPKVLLLGISYPDVYGHMKAHSYSEDILQNSKLSVDQAVECVRRKILTEMDGRDLARCVATEQAGGGHEVYTVSKEMGGIYRNDRHVYASFNNSRGMRKAMHKAFGHVRFQQVILDYYWMPTGWLVTRWNKTLFQETLPDLVKYDMLAFPGSRGRSPRKKRNQQPKANPEHNKDGTYNYNLDLEEGVVFLPFCAHVCKELVGGIHKLKPYYAITFMKKNELPGHALWKGTMTIDGKIMQHRLGKRLDQEEIYCTFQPKDIYESMEDAHVNKDEVMEMLLSIEDFENIRMIRLRPLRQHEPPSVFRKAVVEPEKGGFIGLNREMGRRRFKEFKKRKKNKPLPAPQPKAVPKTKPRKSPKKHNADSDVCTDYESEGSRSSWDADSDSSSDEDDDDQTSKKPLHFDPCDPQNIPQTTTFWPFPALDYESYCAPKDLMDVDGTMAFYAKQWGMKISRKKNKRQSNSTPVVRRFKKTQQDYLSTNPRMPRTDFEEGYRWTVVGSDDEGESASIERISGGKHKGKPKRRSVPGWNLSLKGDGPDAHLGPKLVEMAKRDYERSACCRLFEMKNPGFKTYSRTWTARSSLTACYIIPKESVLLKMAAAEKEKKKRDEEMKNDSDEEAQQELYYYDDDLEDENPSAVMEIDGEKRAASLGLYQLADIAATAPILTNDLRLICETGQRIVQQKSKDMFLPPFRPSPFRPAPKYDEKHRKHDKLRDPIYNPLYNLNPHKDFPKQLFKLLEDSEDQILDHIICWQERGRSFIVNDKNAFEETVLRRCCEVDNATYQSFLTTIMGYGFVEIRVGKRKGGYRHNFFQRGKPKRLNRLVQDGASGLFVVEKEVDDKGAADEGVESNKTLVRRTSIKLPSTNKIIEKLYQLLRKSQSLGLDDALQWEDSGKSFRVYKLNEKFTEKILKDCFSINRYSRFKQELLDRGFKCKEGKKYGIFEHPNFVRGQRSVSKTFEGIKLEWANSRVKDQQNFKSSNDSNIATKVIQMPTNRKRKLETLQDSASLKKPLESNVRKRQLKRGRKSVSPDISPERGQDSSPIKSKSTQSNTRSRLRRNGSNRLTREPLVSNSKDMKSTIGKEHISDCDEKKASSGPIVSANKSSKVCGVEVNYSRYPAPKSEKLHHSPEKENAGTVISHNEQQSTTENHRATKPTGISEQPGASIDQQSLPLSASNKKRKIVSKSTNKPTRRKKKSDASVSLGVTKDPKQSAQDPSSSPATTSASKRGLRSSTKELVALVVK